MAVIVGGELADVISEAIVTVSGLDVDGEIGTGLVVGVGDEDVGGAGRLEGEGADVLIGEVGASWDIGGEGKVLWE